MYFSLIVPKTGLEREAAIQWSKGPYEQHQWLWKFLPSPPNTPRDFLFRRRDSKNDLPGFYLVSPRKPISISDAWEVQSREYAPQLSVGQCLSFQLRANPIITHKVNGKSRRDDVVMQEKQKLLNARGMKRWADWSEEDPEKPLLYELVEKTSVAWLEKRAETYGFKLKEVRADAYMQHRGENKEIRFSTVDFTGELEVIKQDLLREALFKGIGKAKAFGCGLILVKRT